MTLAYVLIQNLRRHPLRTALTTVAFALPMGVFVAAISMVANLRQVAKANEKELRLAVHHRVTMTNVLPEGMRQRIESLDPDNQRIVAVCGMRWFGGRRQNSQDSITSIAADWDSFPVVYSDIAMTPEEIEQWHRERRAAVVGSNLARDLHVHVGRRFSLVSSIPPYLELEFMPIKIMDPSSRANIMYFRRDYLEKSLESADFPLGGCNIFWVKCADAGAMRSLQGEIDAAFANSENETISQDENAFISNFIQATGNIPGLMQVISLVVIFIIALISGNTVMMNFRERIGELAVFKAVGFSSLQVSSLVLGESVMLAMLGSLLGVLPVTTVLSLFPIRGSFLGPVGTISVSSAGVLGALAMALCIGTLAGLWPAYQALRLRTVSALRMLG